jgi:hypothetical protein
MLETSGQISFYSFICRLITNDLAGGNEILLRASEEMRCGLPIAIEFQRATIPEAVNVGVDQSMLSMLPDEMIEAGYLELSHERMHYWQLLNYPIFQMQYIYLLESLRRQTEDRGGKVWVVAGITVGLSASDRESVDFFRGLLESQITVNATHLPAPSSPPTFQVGCRCAKDTGVTKYPNGLKAPYVGMIFHYAVVSRKTPTKSEQTYRIESGVSWSEPARW